MAEASFRFLDLPGELRINVYEQLFQNTLLQVEIPRRLADEHHEERHVVTTGAQLPQILLTSKLIRCEALPIFAKQLTPRFFNWNNKRSGPRQVPAHYLHTAEVAIINEPVAAWVDRKDMPNLEELIVVIEWTELFSLEAACFCGSNSQKFLEFIVGDPYIHDNDEYPDSKRVAILSAEGKVPFKLILKIIGVNDEHGCMPREIKSITGVSYVGVERDI